MHVLLYQEEDEEAEEKEEEYVRNPFLFVCAGCQNLISSSHVCEANILYQARGFRVFSYCDIYFVVFVLFFSAMKCRSYLLQFHLFLQEDLLLPLCCLR